MGKKNAFEGFNHGTGPGKKENQLVARIRTRENCMKEELRFCWRYLGRVVLNLCDMTTRVAQAGFWAGDHQKKNKGDTRTLQSSL